MKTKHPGQKRELYIVAGFHNGLHNQDADLKGKKRILYPQSALLEGIARERKCTGLFQGGVTAEMSKQLNKTAAELRRCGTTERRKMLISIREAESQIGLYGLALQLDMVAGLLGEGSGISYLPTEAGFDQARFIRKLLKSIPDEKFADLIDGFKFLREKGVKTKNELSELLEPMEPDSLGKHEPIRSILLAEKDRGVFRLLLSGAKERNVLQIDRVYRLEGLQSGKHDFEAYRVDFSEGPKSRLMLSGRLKPGLEETVKSVCDKYRIRNKVSFS